MSAGVEAKLGLDTSNFDQGIARAMSEVGTFSREAKKDLGGVSDKALGVAETTESSSQKQVQSWSRVNKAVAGVALVSGGMFKAMVEASPGLSAAFAEMNFMFEEMFMVLGEQLAPIIQDYVVPAIKKLTDFVIELDDKWQMLIASGVGLVAAGATISSALSMVGLSFTALLGPVGLVILAIAAFAYAYKTNMFGVRDTTDEVIGHVIGSITTFADDHAEQIGRIVDMVKEAWEVVWPYLKLWGEFYVEYIGNNLKFGVDIAMLALDMLLDSIEGAFKIIKGIFTLDFDLVMEGFGQIFEGQLDFISGIFDRTWEHIVDQLTIFGDMILGIIKERFGEDVANEFLAFKDTVVDVFNDIVGFITTFGESILKIVDDLFGDQISGKLSIFMDAISKLLNILIGYVNDTLIAPLNDILDQAAGYVDKIPGVSKPDWAIPTIALFGSSSGGTGAHKHGGGIIPGPIGKEVDITALGGEVIYNPMRGQTAETFGGGSNMKVVNNINIINPQLPDRQSQKMLMRTIDQGLRKTQNKYPSGRTG